jgi:hypothetical protein
MAAKIAWIPGQPMGMGMGRPEMAKGMVEINKEAGKLDGMPVYETIRMGGDGTQAQAAAPGEQPGQQPLQSPPSVGFASCSGLGGRFGLAATGSWRTPASLLLDGHRNQ